MSTGVFALAGYLIHDLRETVSVILLDSLEVLNTDRIAALIEHFETYTDYLIVAPPHSPRIISESPTSEQRRDTALRILFIGY